MREFFRGWRRKAGIIVLALACVFTKLWVSGPYTTEGMLFPLESHTVLSVRIRPTGLFAEIMMPYGSKTDAFHILAYWTVPYWSIVIPLTLLSAWLLLSKQPAKLR